MLAKDILSTKYLKVGLNDTVAQMVGKMRRQKHHQALVFDGKDYLGMIDRRFLLTSRVDPSKMKVGNIVKKRSKAKTQFYVPVLNAETDIAEAARLMAAAGTHLLPYEEKGRIKGVVKALDVAEELAKEYKSVACSELASMKLKTLKYDDEIGKALEMMNWEKMEHIPIVDERNKLVGIVAASDFVENYQLWNAFHSMKIPQAASHKPGKRAGYDVGEKHHTMRLPVENIMVPIVYSVQPSTKVSEAISQMCEHDVTSIVLTKNNKPEGILTLSDVFNDYMKT